MVDAQLVENCTAIGFTMDDLDVPVRFNGSQRTRPVVVIGSGGAAYTTVEEVQRQIASVVFRPEVRDRGWPATLSSFKILKSQRPACTGCAPWFVRCWPRRPTRPRHRSFR